MKTRFLFSAVIGVGRGPVSFGVNHGEPAEEEVQLDENGGEVWVTSAEVSLCVSYVIDPFTYT